MNREEKNALHASVLRVTSEDPKWLGYWLNRYQRSEATTSKDVAAQLGIEVAALAILSLCKAPRLDHFSEDLWVACDRSGAKEDVLARIIRQEQTLSNWHEPRPAKTSGWLLAASDADEDATDSAPTAEDVDDDG